MKKYILFTFVIMTFLLVACSDDNAKSDSTSESKAKKSETITLEYTIDGETKRVTTTKEELNQTHYAQYHNVLAEAVDVYGVLPDSGEVLIDPWDTGVYYAELIDFNQDGYEELYVILKGNGSQASRFSHRNSENYVQEVWSGNPEGDTPVLSFSGEISAGECAACNMSVSIIDNLDGKSYLYTHNHHTGQGYVNDEQYFYTKDNSSKLVESSFIIDGDSITIDGQAVDMDTYTTKLEKYMQNERPIIISEGGPKHLAYLPYGSADVSKMLLTLSQHNNKYVGKDGDAQEQLSLFESAFEKERSTKYLNVVDKSNEVVLVGNVLLQGELQYESDPSNLMFIKYKEEDVLNAVEERYGVRLNLTDTLITSPSYSNDLITYENGYFYVLVTDYESTTIDRTISAIHKVANDLYYVELLDNEYDVDSYFYDTMDETNIMTTDKDSLPAEALNYIRTDIRRFAVVKVMNGEPKIQYISTQNLTTDDIKAYK